MTAPTGATPPALNAIRRDLLRLLVVDETLTAISRRLNLSLRTVDSHVAEIKRVFGTSQRLCLGIYAVRDGLVDPQYPISHARVRRLGRGWAAPDARQRTILFMLAAGAVRREAAARLAISDRTVRHELSRLYQSNGIRSDVAAGALFTALEWIRAPSAHTGRASATIRKPHGDPLLTAGSDR